jgi:hypothetical protein
VDSDAVLASLSGVAPLKAIRTLTDITDISEYGLDEPQNTITLVSSDGSETTITIGDENENTADNYVMLNDDSSTVYTADSTILDDLSDNLYDYALSDDLPDLLNNDITGLSVTGSSNDYELQEVSGSWLVQTDDGAEDGDADAISSLLSPLSALSYVDYLEHNCTDLSAYGLDDPQAILTITYQVSESSAEDETEAETETEKGSGTRTLTFTIGSTDSIGNYYVQMEGSAQVHTLSSTTVESFLNCETETLVAEEPESESESESVSESELESEAESEF